MQRIDPALRHKRVIQHKIPRAKLGLPPTSDFGSSGNRDIVQEFQGWLKSTEFIETLPTDATCIYTDGSRHDYGNTGAGAVWMEEGEIAEEFSWPVSTNGTNILGELVAVLNTFEIIVNRGYTNRTFNIFSDCTFVVNIFTNSNQPSDNIDLIDRGREALQMLKQRNVQIVLSWIPGHCGIAGNEYADSLANDGAILANQPSAITNNLDRQYGYSYRTAKRAIKIAAVQQTQKRWNQTNTTLRKYKPILGQSPFLKIGSPFCIQVRTEMRLGQDNLNYNAFRRRKRTETPFCPHCPGIFETVEHFLCRCPAYDSYRRPLEAVFNKIYPSRSERTFSHIGLLRDPPNNKIKIQKHERVIQELNSYITRAYRHRAQTVQK